jgi:hypothetical protein
MTLGTRKPSTAALALSFSEQLRVGICEVPHKRVASNNADFEDVLWELPGP